MVVGVVLVPLLGCLVCPPAGAQDLPDQSIEFLEPLEIADTLADQEEREISIPKPDTTTLVSFDDFMVVAIPRNPIIPRDEFQLVRDSIADRKGLWQSVRLMTTPAARRIGLTEPDFATGMPFDGLRVDAIPRTSIVPQNGLQLVRDSIADRKGLWQSVRLVMAPPERRIGLAAPETTMVVPFSGIRGTMRSKTSIVPQNGLQLVRDSIADRKGLRKTARLIKSERPPYPQTARRQGWEGTVVLRLTIDAGGGVKKVTTQTSSGFPALDQSATQSVKTWRFDPARDGEFRITTVVDLPIRFDLDEYGIKFSREEPEPEPEPEPVKVRKPARLIKSERPDYPQEARKAGWEGTVVLRITIGSGGNVENVTIRESSGFPALDESAAQSVKTWQFTPAKVGDDPISSAVDLPVRFDLEEYQQETGSTE